MSVDGRNPLRWDCDKNGCFNKKKRPKIEEFAECLPGKIAFSDVDAIVEINNKFLVLEWKSYAGDVPVGQKIMYQRMTSSGQFAVFVINGDAETMEVESMAVVRNGIIEPWKSASLDILKRCITKWARLSKDSQ